MKTYLSVCESIRFTKTAELLCDDIFEILGLGHLFHLLFIKSLSAFFSDGLVVVIHVGSIFLAHRNQKFTRCISGRFYAEASCSHFIFPL